MSQDESTPTRSRRERSTRHPSVPLAESVELCKFIEARGLDGLTAADIATALGYKNIKTNTFSARLSAARQFGLLVLKDEGYSLTPLARSILHPVDTAEVPRLYRQALLEPPLYADLAGQFAEKRLPEATILGNVLYHNYQIISSAKQSAAEAFLESARFAGALGEDQVFRPQGATAEASSSLADRSPPATEPPQAPTSVATPRAASSDIRIDLRLWGADAGKSIKLRVPESITTGSLERLLQALRLHVRVEDEGTTREEE